MAFAFGNATGGFGATATPASNTNTTNPAPPFNLSNPTNTPAAPLFGQQPAATPAFGQQPSPAPAFGQQPAPTPTFGQQPAAAPAFGSSTFGSPTPLSTFGSSTSTFGGTTNTNTTSTFQSPGFGQPQQQQQQPQATLSGTTFYKDLSPNMKQNIDAIYNLIQNHEKTMFHIESMGPAVLVGRTPPLTVLVQEVRTKLLRLQATFQHLSKICQEQHDSAQKSVVQATLHGKYSMEALCARKGVRLQPPQEQAEEEKDDAASNSAQLKLQAALNDAMAKIDRIDKIPSEFFYDTLHEIEQRASFVALSLQKLQQQVVYTKQVSNVAGSDLLPLINTTTETQHLQLETAKILASQIHDDMARIKWRYNQFETSDTNVLEQAALKDLQEQRRQLELTQLHCLQAAAAQKGAPATGGLGNAPAPSGGLFASSTAPSGGMFGGSTFTPAPATTGLGSTTTNPAPTFGFAAPNPAPTFGAAPTTSSKKKAGSRRR